MLKEIKGNVKETAVEVKDWTIEHKEGLIAGGILTGVLIGSIVLGRKYDKKLMITGVISFVTAIAVVFNDAANMNYVYNTIRRCFCQYLHIVKFFKNFHVC